MNRAAQNQIVLENVLGARITHFGCRDVMRAVFQFTLVPFHPVCETKVVCFYSVFSDIVCLSAIVT